MQYGSKFPAASKGSILSGFLYPLYALRLANTSSLTGASFGRLRSLVISFEPNGTPDIAVHFQVVRASGFGYATVITGGKRDPRGRGGFQNGNPDAGLLIANTLDSPTTGDLVATGVAHHRGRMKLSWSRRNGPLFGSNSLGFMIFFSPSDNFSGSVVFDGHAEADITP